MSPRSALDPAIRREDDPRAVRRGILFALSLLPACAASGRCAPSGACGVASWRGAAIDTQMLSLPVTDLDDGAAYTASGASFSVSPRAARLRFDLRALPRGAAITRAVLSLRASPDGARADGVTLRARALLAPWRAGSADETPRGGAAATVTLPRGARGPVRVDVTDALREAAAWGRAADGLSLETDGGSVAFVGPWDPRGAPRLEVAAR